MKKKEIRNLSTRRLIKSSVLYRGFLRGLIKSHAMVEQLDGSFIDEVVVDFGDYEITSNISSLKKEMIFTDFITFTTKRNVLIAVVGIKGKTQVGWAVYNPNDDKDNEFAKQLAVYRAVVDKNANADEFEVFVDETVDELERYLADLEMTDPEVMAAYNDGYTDGFDEGYENGFDEACDEYGFGEDGEEEYIPTCEEDIEDVDANDEEEK